MTLDDAYAAYRINDTPETLAILYDALTRYVRKLTAVFQCGDKESITLDIVAKVYDRLASYTPRPNVHFASWVRTIARNYIMDVQAKRQSQDEQMDEADEARAHYTVSYHREHDPQSLPLTADQKQIVDILLDTGSYAETAQRLGITMKALYRRLDRIKARCQQQGNSACSSV